ncbi:tetratricopeptide repeat protein [Altererythrobacter fulvus]|uniref:tetratricopeptide repeat protein n=1 Tax=Caenibius fulvus TaxID=2126012 RepID=UPI003018AF3E
MRLKALFAILLAVAMPAAAAAQEAEHPAVTKGREAFNAGDPAGARAAFGEACDAGSVDGCYRVAVFMSEGAGGPVDQVQARAKLRRACTELPQFLPAACEMLGQYLDKGRGGPADPVGARAAFGEACGSSHALGCFNYGALQFNGVGGPKDKAGAFLAFTLACDLEYFDACVIGGQMLENGDLGKPDYGTAELMYRRGCDKQHQPSCHRVGELYANGLAEVD